MADPLTKACYPCSIDVHGDCRRHEGEPCGCQVGEFCGVKVRVFIASEPRPVADPLADVIRQALAGGASGSSVTPADLAAAAVRAHLAAEPPSETLRLVLEQQAANVQAIDGIVEALQQDNATLEAENDRLKDRLRRAEDRAAVLSDLDRCEHGRHEGDVCSGATGCDGPSLGNPIAGNTGATSRWKTADRQIGFTMSRTPIVVPERRRMHDADAWRAR